MRMFCKDSTCSGVSVACIFAIVLFRYIKLFNLTQLQLQLQHLHTSLGFEPENERVSDDHFLQYLTHRQYNSSWFVMGKYNRKDHLPPNADKDGPILDFIIAGFAKCGTTTISANLALIAPMPKGDVCTPFDQLVYYSYINWPKKFNETVKLYRGAKCPSMIFGMQNFEQLPRMKVIVGIRHPVLWFQSFWNMQARNFVEKYKTEIPSPYNLTKRCTGVKGCKRGCPKNQFFCIYTGRFHLALALLGKTPLTTEERELLAPNDRDGGRNIEIKKNVTNPLFLYEQTQLGEDYVWEELSQFLNYYNGTLQHNNYVSSHGSTGNSKWANTIDICTPEYDDLRALMMPYAYEMSRWICDHFVPIESDNGVVVPKRDVFCKIVRGYENDPCGRLIRVANGTYVLKVDGV